MFDIIDFQLCFCAEMIEHNGEDSFFTGFSDKYSIISVFDGCGGLGAKTYSNYKNKSGAYIASRAVSGATDSWFDNLTANSLNAADYKSYIDRALAEAGKYSGKNSTVIRGSMQKAFPSTVATAVSYCIDKKPYVSYFWSGDSRGYILDDGGLHQITDDDIDGEDAMSNLQNDGVLTNVVSLDGNYAINQKTIEAAAPSVVICSTDGCFGYLSTPMEFEYLILDTLLKSNSANEWETNLIKEIGKFASDDYTLVLQPMQYGSFLKLKQSFLKRYEYLKKRYIKNLKSASYDDRLSLWKSYKEDYYKY